MNSTMTILMIAGFGALGVLARFGIDSSLANKMEVFPLSTFITNIVGSFLIGVIYVLGKEKGLMSDSLGIAIGVGLLGGFTTFSAFSLQTVLMTESRQTVLAIIYLLASPILGVLAAYFGLAVTRYFI